MKRLPLKTVMNSLRIVMLECGYELHNAAGTAKYDEWGVREEVHGIPEYFPITISLKGPDFAAPSVNAEDSIEQVEFKADRFAVIGTALSTIKNEQARINGAEVKTRLSDDMREAVIDAVRESDLFKSLQASLDSQASSQVTMQLTISQAVTDAIRNAVKHGGLLFGKR